MLKIAYQLGVQAAFEEAGLEKHAGILDKGVKYLAEHGGRFGKGVEQASTMAGNNPLLAKILAGAGVGGLGGAAFGDEGGMMRGALMGAGVGAGAHGGKLMGLGRSGRMARNIGRTGTTAAGDAAATAGVKGVAQSELARMGDRAALGAGAGALGAGVLGYGLGGGVVPGRGEPPPWYRR